MSDFSALRDANLARDAEWLNGKTRLSLSFRGNEMAGEVGEACNVLKKLDRERMGIAGSRDTVDHLAEELADVVICADLVAMDCSIDLWPAIVRKFNATSAKRGFATRLAPETLRVGESSALGDCLLSPLVALVLQAIAHDFDRGSLLKMLVALRDHVTSARAPDVLIGGEALPYMKRWWLIPRNRYGFNVYLHQFLRSDDDRALHDHPWANLSILIDGAYTEHTPDGAFRRVAGDIAWRSAEVCHRIALDADRERVLTSAGVVHRPTEKPCWTLFVTGPKVREWGFHCPRGWVHWTDFTGQNESDGPVRVGVVGRGCGETDA